MSMSMYMHTSTYVDVTDADPRNDRDYVYYLLTSTLSSELTFEEHQYQIQLMSPMEWSTYRRSSDLMKKSSPVSLSGKWRTRVASHGA